MIVASQLNIAIAIVSVLVLLGLVAWSGLKVLPKPFPTPLPGGAVDTMPLPKDLPAPVERFYRQAYGKRIPIYHSVIFSGVAVIKPFAGISMPARFLFIHDAGKGYRHYIEATFFGFPILKVNERYLDGKSLIQLPFSADQGPKVDQAANIGMWAELLNAPTVYLTDGRVRWQAVDEETALLTVPFESSDGAHTETFVVRFDPQSGMPSFTEIMRYRDSKSPHKFLWITRTVVESPSGSFPLNSTGSAMWYDDGKPWALFTTLEVIYNADIHQYLHAQGA